MKVITVYLMKVITVYLMKVISVPDEGYYSVPDEGYYSVPDEGYYSVPDDGYSRIVLCTTNLNILHLISDDFLTKMMFVSSLSPVVCSTTHVLFMFFVVICV